MLRLSLDQFSFSLPPPPHSAGQSCCGTSHYAGQARKQEAGERRPVFSRNSGYAGQAGGGSTGAPDGAKSLLLLFFFVIFGSRSIFSDHFQGQFAFIGQLVFLVFTFWFIRNGHFNKVVN